MRNLNYKDPRIFRTHLLSSELLKILATNDLAHTFNVSEVIHQIKSKVSNKPIKEIKRMGSIYENILVIIYSFKIKQDKWSLQIANCYLVAEILETLSSLYYVTRNFLQQEHSITDDVNTLKNKLQIEALQGVLQ